MRKMTLGLVLTAAALVLFVSPAGAASSPALSAADQAFIASLAAQGGAPAPTPAANRPGGMKALCSASARCWDDSTVSCAGNNSTTSCSATDSNCPSTRGRVTCDGITTNCPICPGCNFDCAAERTQCQWDCDPCPFAFTCSPSTCTLTCRCKWSICPI